MARPTVVVIMPMLHGKTTLARAFPSAVVDADDMFAPQPERWRNAHRAAIMRRDWDAVATMERALLEGEQGAFPTGRVLLVHNDGLLRHATTPWMREVDRWHAVEPLRLGEVLHRARIRVGPAVSASEAAHARGVMELAVSNWRQHVDGLARLTADGVKLVDLPAVIRLAADRASEAATRARA